MDIASFVKKNSNDFQSINQFNEPNLFNDN